MSKAQLPLLTSIIMVTQAFLSAPAGIRAKRSIKDRNQVLLLGYAAMIAADLSFALIPSVLGKNLPPHIPHSNPSWFPSYPSGSYPSGHNLQHYCNS